MGETPVTAIRATAQYTGTVTWEPAVSATFAASTLYTATITLSAKSGYTLRGLSANFFKLAGAAATHPANSGVVRAVFPATGTVPPTKISISEITGLTAPAMGATPDTTINETPQYTGTVTWEPDVSGTFAAATVYTAIIDLTAKSGYTWRGLSADFFKVAGAAATHPANSGVVRAVFPKTENAVAVFNGVQYQTLYEAIEAANNAESGEIGLLASVTAPESGTTGGYTITGNIKILPLGHFSITATAGGFPLFTVNSGATLTLQEGSPASLTLDGRNEPAAADRRGVVVSNSGSLVMGANVIITGFKNTGYGGGVYVNGGTFTMNGGTIRANSANQGGGVYVNNGTFTMANSGDAKIYGRENSPNDNTNTTSGSGSLFLSAGTAKYSDNTNILSGGGTTGTDETLPNSGGGGSQVGTAQELLEAINFAPTSGTSVDNPTVITITNSFTVNAFAFTIASGQHIKLVSAGNTDATITTSLASAAMFTVNSSASLTLGGNSYPLTLSGVSSGGPNHSGVRVNTSGRLVMNNNVTIQNFSNTTGNGGGVYTSGTFIMKGGEIRGNRGLSGGGVYINNYGRLFMTGGTIFGNGPNPDTHNRSNDGFSLFVNTSGGAYYGEESVTSDPIISSPSGTGNTVEYP